MSDIDIEHLRSLGDQKVLCKASQLVQLIEAAAAKDAECERLRLSLGRATVDLMGMRDGALVRDQAVEIDSLRASVAAKDAEITSLRARLAAAEAALRPIADAASDLDDNESGEIWERPAAMSIDCDHLRAAAAYFATKEPPHD